MNIFSSIWKKHFKRGADPIKLADDVGPLKGIFGFKKYDTVTGKLLDTYTQSNLLVNQSKTNLIRLISQGQSPWTGQINPAELKISRMRFGNGAFHTQPNKLYYYDFNELSSRNAVPLNQGGESTPRFAGGLSTQPQVYGIPIYVDTHPDAASAGQYQIGLNNMKKYPIKECQDLTVQSANPPSHGTLVVKLFTPASPNTPVETIYFENPVYTKTRGGIVPTKIVSASAVDTTWISKPNLRDEEAGTQVIPSSTGLKQTGTRLIYDYAIGSRGWKFMIDEISSAPSRFSKIEFHFEIGKYNIINTIVPQVGWNQNLVGTYEEKKNQIPLRFQGNQDYYNIVSTEYRDAEEDYVDDFSVTFGINMPGHLGNGNTDAASAEVIRYKEAFLFNGRNELFSSVWLPNQFDKNSSAAYFISWTILSPVN